jgi:hypothetical protein
VLYTAESRGAKHFSAGFETFVQRLDRDEMLGACVGCLPDITSHLFLNLLAKASKLVRAEPDLLISKEVMKFIEPLVRLYTEFAPKRLSHRGTTLRHGRVSNRCTSRTYSTSANSIRANKLLKGEKHTDPPADVKFETEKLQRS